MAGGKVHARKRVTATRGRQIAGRQPVKPAPAHPTLLTAPPQRAPPVSRQRPTKALQRAPVSRHPVVLKIASYHPPQPLPGLARRGVHPRPKLFLDFRRLRPHPLSHRLAPNHKASALPVDLADVRESQKVEGLQASLPHGLAGQRSPSVRTPLSFVRLAARDPVPWTRLPAAARGPCGPRPRSPWRGCFPPDSPPTLTRLGSNRSSVLPPAPTPRRRACGACGVRLPPRPALRGRRLQGLPVLVRGVS